MECHLAFSQFSPIRTHTTFCMKLHSYWKRKRRGRRERMRCWSQIRRGLDEKKESNGDHMVEWRWCCGIFSSQAIYLYHLARTKEVIGSRVLGQIWSEPFKELFRCKVTRTAECQEVAQQQDWQERPVFIALSSVLWLDQKNQSGDHFFLI